MAGLFQVFWGTQGGGFKPCTALNGSDGKPLVITATKQQNGEVQITDQICTRPTAADLDGDGHLDLVVGNFRGTFAFFRGEGEGKFTPANTWLGIQVGYHSDPCIVDWDGDGDLDIVSGSSSGGAFLFPNSGSKTKPEFKTKITLVDIAKHPRGHRFGDAHLTGPQRDTRVWVDDVNGDGKLDLLMGDAAHLMYPADGLDEAEARARLEKWTEKQRELSKSLSTADKEARTKARKAYSAHYKKRAECVREDRTGFVWVLYQH